MRDIYTRRVYFRILGIFTVTSEPGTENFSITLKMFKNAIRILIFSIKPNKIFLIKIKCPKNKTGLVPKNAFYFHFYWILIFRESIFAERISFGPSSATWAESNCRKWAMDKRNLFEVSQNAIWRFFGGMCRFRLQHRNVCEHWSRGDQMCKLLKSPNNIPYIQLHHIVLIFISHVLRSFFCSSAPHVKNIQDTIVLMWQTKTIFIFQKKREKMSPKLHGPKFQSIEFFSFHQRMNPFSASAIITFCCLPKTNNLLGILTTSNLLEILTTNVLRLNHRKNIPFF